jgi:hypothetical protein
MDADKDFLNEVFGLVGISSKHQRPPENRGLKSSHERCECCVVARGGAGGELHVERVRRSIAMRRRIGLRIGLQCALA